MSPNVPVSKVCFFETPFRLSLFVTVFYKPCKATTDIITNSVLNNHTKICNAKADVMNDSLDNNDEENSKGSETQTITPSKRQTLIT